MNQNHRKSPATRRPRPSRNGAKRRLPARKQTLSPYASGAIAGASVWLAYATIETFFSVILPWFMTLSYDYRPLSRGFTAMLFVLYPTVGAVLGAFIGYLARGRENLRPVSTSAAIITVIAVFDLNLVVEFPLSYLSVKVTLLVSLVLALACVMTLISRDWQRRLAFVANPWSSLTLLIGIMWLLKDHLWNTTAAYKGIWLLASIIAVAGVSGVVQFVSGRNGKGQRRRRTTAAKVSAQEGPSQAPCPAYSRLRTTVPVAVVTFLISLAPHQSIVRQPSGAVAGTSRTNVIIIVMDTVRADHLSAYGYGRRTSSNLERFASEAVLYRNAIAPGPLTLSSHASMFTGLYPRTHGAHYDSWGGYPNGRPLDEKFTTLTEVLARNGYNTRGVAANIAFLSHAFRIDQGFEHFDCRWPVFFLSNSVGHYIRRGVRDIISHFFNPSMYDESYKNADEINDIVMPLLDDAARGGRPTFLFINYMDAHDPYIPPPPFDTMYSGKIEDYSEKDYNVLMQTVLKREVKVSPEVRAHLVSQYDGSITYLDDRLGVLFDRLKELGLYDDSLIIVTSDHGEAFGEKDFIQHGNSVYQDQVHVPLIIKRPDSDKGEVVEEPVSLVDVMPTVLAAVGIPMPERVHGQDILSGTPDARRIIYAESYPDGFIVNYGTRFNGVRRAVVDGTDKLITSPEDDRELYDLSVDPNEELDYSVTDTKKALRLDAALATWLQKTVVHKGKAASMNREATERLKALGYVQ